MYRRRKEEKTKQDLSERVESFFLSKASSYLVFFWAMSEALFWFVIPEFLLLLVVFMKIKNKRQLLVYDVAGTVAGTLIAFMLHVPNQIIEKLPYIQPKMVELTINWFTDLGIFGLFYQPFSGVPYKVFTLTATQFHFNMLAFIVLAVLVRMSRYTIFFAIFVALYPGLHKVVHKNYFKLFVCATFIFSVFLLKVARSFS